MARSNKLFKDLSISNDVSRNGFDLSRNVSFTSKCGELLPLLHMDCMLGDKIKIRCEHTTRTIPIVTAAFTRINEYLDFFFVPYRLLGKQIPHILMQDTTNPTIASSPTSNVAVGTKIPHLAINRMRGLNPPNTESHTVPNCMRGKKNEFGFYRYMLAGKLMNHLGYCFQTDARMAILSGVTDPSNVTDSGYSDSNNGFSMNLECSLLPLAAYQKIYYDHFRHTQWEKQVAYNYNFDYMTNNAYFSLPSLASTYWDNPTMFDLRYSNYPKDLFFGLYPDSQFGDTAIVEVDIESSQTGVRGNVVDSDGNLVVRGGLVNQSGDQGNYGIQNGTDSTSDLVTGELYTKMDEALSTLRSNFDILEFRKARFAQKFKEIMGTGKRTYKDIARKVFGVDIPDTLTDECIYLGGSSSTIVVSEVENTNLVNYDPELSNGLNSSKNSAIQRGKGYKQNTSSLIDLEVKEPGILMCIYHASPEIDYALNAFHFDVVKTDVDDFANPIFDKLGLEELPVYFLDNTQKNNVSQTPTIAWTSRYFNYKTAVDMVLGDFRNTSKTWVAPLTPEYLFEYSGTNEDRPGIVIDYRFFKVNPKILDVIFGIDSTSYSATDQLRSKARFEVHAVRNLDYLGIPRG